MHVQTFGVIGAGQMGGGIAQVAAASGLNVILQDISTECVERGLAVIAKNLQHSVDKGKYFNTYLNTFQREHYYELRIDRRTESHP